MCYFSGFVCITGCDNPRNPVMLPSIDQLLSGAREFYSWQMAEWALRHVWRYNITLNLHEDCVVLFSQISISHISLAPSAGHVPGCDQSSLITEMSQCHTVFSDQMSRLSRGPRDTHSLVTSCHVSRTGHLSTESHENCGAGQWILSCINILTKRKKEGRSWCVIEMFLWSHSSRYPPSPWLHCTLSRVPRVRDNSIKTWSKLIYKQSRYTAIHLFTASYTLLI